MPQVSVRFGFIFELTVPYMAMKTLIAILALTGFLLTSCIFVWQDRNREGKDSAQLVSLDSSKAKAGRPAKDTAVLVVDTLKTDSVLVPAAQVHTRNVHPQDVVSFAKTLIGIPYRYASTDPQVGFDCSGFITYVFSHFHIIVPRSSIDFTNVGRTVPADSARTGDLILFTGTDSTERFVGHMGLVVSNEQGQLQFIHSTSGKKHGVTITPFDGYYRGRYIKTIRIFPENERPR